MSTPFLSDARRSPAEIPIISIADLDADPHGIFKRYRGKVPIVQRADGAYVAIRASHVEALTTDPRTRQIETELVKARGITSGPLFDTIGQSMLFSNDAEHRRRRAPMSRAFAFRTVAEIRPRIREIAERLIRARLREGGMNLIEDYTALVPALTIASILGLAEEDVPRFTQWVYSLSRAFSSSFLPSEVPDITNAASALREYVETLLAERRREPREDFLTGFMHAAEQAGELSPAEMVSQIVLVTLGGSDTTRAALATLVALLLQDRTQWEAVCADADLIPGAVTEALRYEPAVGSVPRFTVAEIELDGHIVPAGRILSLSTLSALRDPAVYADPDRFDIRRTDHQRWHMAFGGGAHRCLGEALARIELEEGLAALAEHLPGLRLFGPPLRLHGHSGIRRIEPLRVTWSR